MNATIVSLRVTLTLGVVPFLLPASAAAQATRLLELHGVERHAAFGRPASVGDVDGDGFGDFAIGALFENTENGIDSGATYLYSGRDGALIRRWIGDDAGDTLGGQLKNVGDHDGDGFDEIAVAANSWNQTAKPQYIRVYSGRFMRDRQPPEVLYTIHGKIAGDFGAHLDGGVDIDGDGIEDLLIGCSLGQTAAFVYSGATHKAIWEMRHTNAAIHGLAVAALDDVDGDGNNDFAVGAHHEHGGLEFDVGKVWIYSGGGPLQIGRLIDELEGDEAYDRFGIEVESMGDVDGDGIREFIVGAAGFENFGPNPGYVRVYSGATRELLATMRGETPGDYFGGAITAGDLDGDSLDDVVVSARNLDDGNNLDAGSVTAYSGADWSVLFDLRGDGQLDKVGRVSATGDINGDGADDVVIGSGHVGNTGAAYVASLSPSARWEVFGTGRPGKNGVIPRLSLDADPVLDSSFVLHVGNSSGSGTLGILFAGTAPIEETADSNPLLLVQPLLTIALPFPDGADLELPQTLPYDAKLCYAVIRAQVLELDPWAVQGISASCGIELTLGGSSW